MLLSIVFTVSASIAGYGTEASVSTDHWYPGRLPAGYSEYQLELTVHGESISSVTVEGPNVPSTFLKYEKTLDSGEWRWTTSVGLPGKPSVGDTYTFTITYTNSSTEVLRDSVSGTIEEFPEIISPVHAGTITTTRPVFKWTALTTKLRSIGIIVADPELGDLLWMGDIPINDTSAVYNFDGKGKPLQAGKKYIWLLIYRDVPNDNGAFIMSEFTIEGKVGVLEEMNTLHPSAFYLSQNFPNPFNLVTTIEFSVPRSEFVTLRVFNMLGGKVATLVEKEVFSGSHTIAWNASGFASGLYFYRLEASSTILTKKLLLMK